MKQPRAFTRSFRGTALCGLLLALPLAAQVTPAAKGAAVEQATLDSELQPHVARSLLLDATRVGNGFVAVGERGHVLLSSDGEKWSQVDKVPTRSTLTTVTAVGNDVWAGGHDGAILHSADAGKTWTRQRIAPWSRDDTDPSHGVPVLDLLFSDAQHGIAIGAYQLILTTSDGGKTWTNASAAADTQAPAPTAAAASDDDDALLFSEAELQLDDEADPHLNAIARTGAGTLVIVGERGTVFRSSDNGATWKRSKLPYGGSMFGVLGFDGDRVLVFGLRGNVFESSDGGTSWTKIASDTESSLMGGSPLPNGGAVLVGTQGVVLRRDAAAAPLHASTFVNGKGETPGLAGVLAVGKGYAVFGERGAELFMPKP